MSLDAESVRASTAGRRAKRQLRTVLTQLGLRRDSEPPLLVTYPVDSGYGLPKDFPLPELEGLICCWVAFAQDDGKSLLSTCWKSEAHFQTQDKRLRKLAGIGAAPERVSRLASLVASKPPLWKRFSVYGVLLAVAGFLGALEALHSRYGLFFGAPETDLIIEGSAPAHWRTDAPAAIEIRVANRSRVVASRVRVEDVRLRDERGSQVPEGLSFQYPKRLGPIDIGEDETLVIQARPALPPGLYKLSITALIEGGLLLDLLRSTVVQVDHPVRVWRPWAIQETMVSSILPDQTWFSAELHAGRSYDRGLNCTVELIGQRDVAFSYLLMQGSDEPVVLTSGAGDVTIINWRTPPLDAFSESSFKFSAKGTAADWPALASEIVFRCEEEREQQ